MKEGEGGGMGLNGALSAETWEARKGWVLSDPQLHGRGSQ